MGFQTVHDPLNCFPYNYNKGNWSKILDEYYNDLFVEKDSCLTCKAAYEKPLRDCYKKGLCKWKLHRCYSGSGDGKVGYFCFETSGTFDIYIRRGLANFIYQNGYGFIYRTTKQTGLICNHINHDESDDRLENISIVSASFHSSYHSRIRGLERKLGKLLKEKEDLKISKAVNTDRYVEVEKLIYRIFTEIAELNNKISQNCDRHYELVEGIEKAISKGVIYTCPPEWSVKNTPPKGGHKRGKREDVASNKITYK